MKKYIYLVLIILVCAQNLMGQEYERYKKLTDTTITSQYLGFNKNITVTVPFEWQKDIDRDFPLIIIFDRQNPRSHNYIINTIDYLTSNEQMPSAVIISVESEQEFRYQETQKKISSDKGLAKENEMFIFQELIPLAEQQFHASSFRLFIGHSRYGYFTSSLLFSRINELNSVISLSPFFTQNNVDLTDSVKTLNNLSFNSTKYYRFGIGNDYPDDFVKMDSAVHLLQNSDLNIKGYLFKEADHNVTPGLTIAISLYEIFEKWSNIQNEYFSNDQKDLQIIDSLNKEIVSHYGCSLEFSLGILNGKGWYFYGEKEYDKAIEAWRLLLNSYPNLSEGYLYIIDAQVQLQQDASKTIEEFNRSLARSEIYTDQEKKELIQELESLIE